MAKFYGPIGYVQTVETSPGIWTDEVTERNAYGEEIKPNSTWVSNPDSTNDNLKINKKISIVADPYALSHYSSIKYVEFMGVKWKVTNVEPNYPRLILTLGGLYNG